MSVKRLPSAILLGLFLILSAQAALFDRGNGVGDADLDQIPDDIDNCTNVANPLQEDADFDDHGNVCDADFDQNCGTDFGDLAMMQAGFFTVDAVLDLNSSGGPVNFADLAIMQNLIFLTPGPSAAGACTPAPESTVAGTATASAPSSTWLAYTVPFTGDDDHDGWSVVELGLAPGGPFDLAIRKIPGPPEWRADSFGGLTADTDYYLQVTFIDPDGVAGTNPQILGPIRTLVSAPNAVTLGTVTVEARETEIHVSAPISNDANHNSYGTVEIAPDPGGPWTERCGSPSDNRLPYHPKRCRLRSLIPGTSYWVRIQFVDADGVSGANPQVLGPITYVGRENLAAGRPITADPGWGCCPNPAQLVDSRIQYRFWPYGFAWTGGINGYGGGPAGWKQATIDLGTPTAFDRVEMWLHDGSSPPTDWRVETSNDGASWTEAWSTTDPQCRGAAEQLGGTSWQQPACSQVALFAPVTARYVRYWFDDRTLFGGLHGWAVELEVFAQPQAPNGAGH